MDTNIPALNLLNTVFSFLLILPVLVELRERVAYIINKKLRQISITLNNKAEELAMVVVNNVTELLLEWEWL